MADGILKVGTITNSAGSGNITIGSGVTVNVNRPSFKATLSANQSLATGTWTKITLDQETWDTDSTFASNKFTVPTSGDGKYCFLYASQTGSLTSSTVGQLRIYKNGVAVPSSARRSFPNQTTGAYPIGSVVLELVATDYIELYGQQTSGGAANFNGDSGDDSETFLVGYKLGA